jgi:hypothetical protein
MFALLLLWRSQRVFSYGLLMIRTGVCVTGHFLSVSPAFGASLGPHAQKGKNALLMSTTRRALTA